MFSPHILTFKVSSIHSYVKFTPIVAPTLPMGIQFEQFYTMVPRDASTHVSAFLANGC